MSPGRKLHILVISQSFIIGGGGYLALRHIKRLLAYYEIDFLVTGLCDEDMIRQLPQEVSMYRLDDIRADYISAADPLGSLDLFLKRCSIPPFRRSYYAVLATSVFIDWRACLAVSIADASRKLVCVIDEMLGSYSELWPRDRSAVECCIDAADLFLPVSSRLWRGLIERCTPLAAKPWQLLMPPLNTEKEVLATDADKLLSAGRDRSIPMVLTVARLSPEKQLLRCLHIHHKLREEGLSFVWYIVGRGPEELLLKTEIKRLGMESNFLLAGASSNAASWMRECDIFALFSSSEGCPTVVMEALWAGCPVIMTDVNGSDELIVNGSTGLVVENSTESIASGLRKLICDGEMRAMFRANIAKQPLPDAAEQTRRLISLIEGEEADTQLPLVTIIIPTYNQEAYIDRAISSALMQDFGSLEVIVVDDASTDRTGDIALAWRSDPRFRYIRNDANMGRVRNYRNALCEHAHGEWVLMLDGDDYLLDQGFIRRAYEAISRHAGRPILFAQAGHRVCYIDGKRADVDLLPEISGSERLMTGGEYLHFVYATGFFTHLGILYNRDAAIGHGCYTADISSSDMESFLRLAMDGEVLILNTIAGCWVQHEANASSNVELRDIPANVRIFRNIARMAVRRGLTSMQQIDGVLTICEARTLAYLFNKAIGKTARGPMALLRMVAIIVSVNPRLLISLRMLYFGCRGIRQIWRQCLLRIKAGLAPLTRINNIRGV